MKASRIPVLCFASLALSLPSRATTTRIVLHDAASGTILALGSETVRDDGRAQERTTTYASPDGKTNWVEETAEFAGGELRRFVSSDLRTGERLEVRVVGNGKFHIEAKAAADASSESVTLDTPAGSLLGKSIPPLLMQRWKDLKNGETVSFRLVVPEREATYAFRARQMEGATAARTKILVEPDSLLIRLFAPNLVFTFEEGRLRELTAPSPLVLDGERYRRVRMVFEDQRGAEAPSPAG